MAARIRSEYQTIVLPPRTRGLLRSFTAGRTGYHASGHSLDGASPARDHHLNDPVSLDATNTIGAVFTARSIGPSCGSLLQLLSKPAGARLLIRQVRGGSEVGTLLGNFRRGIVYSALLAFASMVLVAAPTGSAGGASLPHVYSPPTVNASAWQPTSSHDPAGNTSMANRAASCATSTFCISVGFYYVGVQGFPLIQQWNGSSWIAVTPAVTPEFNFDLNSVSCVSTTFCEAVGYTQATNSSPDLPLAMVWNGSSWSTQPVPIQAGQTSQRLEGVSCLSTTWCLAVGESSPSLNILQSQAMSVQWNGSQWTNVVVAPNPGPGGGIPANVYSVFSSVSCTSPSWCQAVGGWMFTDYSYGAGLLEKWNGVSWSLSPLAAIPSGNQSWLSSISCAGQGFCAAVGYSYTGSPEAPTSQTTLTQVWNGAGWATTPSPNLGGANGDFLNGVSCFSATSCSAVGTYATDNTGNHYQNEALVWNGQSWAEVTPADDAAATSQSLNAVDCISDWACMAAGDRTGGGAGDRSWIIMSSIARSGYRFVASDGGIFSYGAGAPFLGSLGGTHLNAPIVGMAVMPAGDGYYLVASDGGVFAYGSAQFYGSMGGQHLNKPIVGMAVTADGGGYWLVASDGGIFSFGDAAFYGSTGAVVLNKPVVGMAPTSNGLGYYLVASDGGIFSYGNAVFYGSTGAIVLNQPVVGMTVSTAGGYWFVASDGGVFNYGPGASFLGSMGGQHLNRPVVGMTASGGGYYLSASDGGVFTFPPGGQPPFLGSTGNIALNKPIVGIAG